MTRSKTDLTYQRQLAEGSLKDFVYSFWELKNTGKTDSSVTVLPDGYFDVLFTSVNGAPFKARLIGLSTKPTDYIIPACSHTYSVCLKLPAAEYILKRPISHLLDSFEPLPAHSEWLDSIDKANFEKFVSSAKASIMHISEKEYDTRKLILFQVIYESNGDITVQNAAKTSLWSGRQINRFFREYFNLPLKTYCNILRFAASFEQLNDGRLFPEHNFYDQAHFIHAVNKFADSTPSRLSKNANDRFIQLSVLTPS